MDSTTSREEQYQHIKSTLLSTEHVLLSLPTSPAKPIISQQSQTGRVSTIASLSLHPALEAALHVLNRDLPSAHFLLRHAQSPPAWECMFLHGILHRLEGDIQNARCWYGDVKDSEVLKHVWSRSHSDGTWEQFLDRVERQRDAMAGRQGSGAAGAQRGANSAGGERADLQRISLWELTEVLHFLEDKFGIQEVADAGSTWVQSEGQVTDKANAMIVGGEGWREF